jgi:predicted RNase H-related nuclease YkuK (DUF458 family)
MLGYAASKVFEFICEGKTVNIGTDFSEYQFERGFVVVVVLVLWSSEPNSHFFYRVSHMALLLYQL